MKLTDEQLSELKRIETQMLCAFIQVCEKLKLRYYLVHGTLLGAVRHKGFIPWDDDIDVGMPRQDYDIFLEKGQALLPSNLFIQTMHTDGEYLLWFAKIRRSDTTYIESSSRKRKINHGVFIDVFPLDYYPEDAAAQRKIAFMRKWYTRRISCELTLPDHGTLTRKVKTAVLKFLFPSIESVLQKRSRLYIPASPSSIYVNYGGGRKEIMPAAWYAEGTTVLFEGLQVKAPVEYDKVLTRVYGDYMRLPPAEKRVGHHYVDVLDLNRSYTEYVEGR